MPVPGGVDAIITLADAKAQLNKTSTVDDDELQYFVDAACLVIERLAGHVVAREVTETARQRGGPTSIVLTERPVLSVTSLTSIRDGTAYDVSALYVDNPLAGIVRRTDGGVVSGGPWTAVYQVGRTEVPANIGLAGRVLVQHLWETQRGGPVNVARLDTSMQEGFPGVWFAVPNRVKELCEGESVSLMAY